MVVQHNISAMNANRYYGINNSGLSKSLEKLSSGYKINRAGDDAAGLAVSEKMRSQIAGITQAVKNAQDGISMVQTFEGALTETDSILQRMKTLANQSANGTYQDDVDREAIQLEFDQLNDELNQIADTDFNGVIVLNGGRMADGLEAVDGKFNYDNLKSQLDAEKAAKLAELNAQKATLSASTPKDITTDTAIWGTLDDSKYQATEATQLWTDLGLDADKVDSVDVTYTATVNDDGTTTYKATSGVDSNGNALTEDQLKEFTTTAVDGSTTTTGKGGFTASAGGTDNVNVIFDATKIKTGDVVTIKYTGPGAKAKAPTNIGFENDSIKFVNANAADIKGKETELAVALDTGLNDVAMTKDVADALDYLNGKEFSVLLGAGVQSIKGANDAAQFPNIKIGTTAVTNTGSYTDGTNKLVFALTNGNKIKISTTKDGATADVDLLEIDLSGIAANDSDTTLNFKLAVDSYAVPGATTVDAETKATDLGEEIAANQAKIDEIDAQIKALDEDGVSVSNAYNNADIPMTYTEDITLQTGARSKDAVTFTFKYASKGIGELDANMNCSARDGGLETESLSLRTAEDANFAIDKIDQAINKVSMVRGTFGAIQNRLEHKIDNMNVTKENLTSAESRIRDTNMAEEMSNFTKNQILSQAAQSMLAQANSLPQSVLQLLG